MNLDINFLAAPGFKEGDVVYLNGGDWPWEYRGTEQVVTEGGCIRIEEKNVAGKTISSFFEIKKSEYSDYSAWLIKSAEMVKLEKIEAMMEFLGGRLYGDAFRKMVAELEDQE